MKKFRFALSVFFVTVIIAVMLTVNAVAEITVQNGTVVGLDPNTVYDYAQVTLTNYNAPSYTSLSKGSTRYQDCQRVSGIFTTDRPLLSLRCG